MIPEREDSLVHQVRAQATAATVRRFAVTLLAALPLAGFFWLVLLRFTTGRWEWSVMAGFASAALVLGGGALLSAGWARRLYVGWHMVTRTLECVLTWILLAIAFWFVITPAGLLRRRKSRAFLRKPAPERESYWQESAQVKDPARYYRQF